jgi:hypothetical protein
MLHAASFDEGVHGMQASILHEYRRLGQVEMNESRACAHAETSREEERETQTKA